MSYIIAGLLTLLVPIIGQFIARGILKDFKTAWWTLIPVFWIPPFSLVPAIKMWKKQIGPPPTTTAPA